MTVTQSWLCIEKAERVRVKIVSVFQTQCSWWQIYHDLDWFQVLGSYLRIATVRLVHPCRNLVLSLSVIWYESVFHCGSLCYKTVFFSLWPMWYKSVFHYWGICGLWKRGRRNIFKQIVTSKKWHFVASFCCFVRDTSILKCLMVHWSHLDWNHLEFSRLLIPKYVGVGTLLCPWNSISCGQLYKLNQSNSLT